MFDDAGDVSFELHGWLDEAATFQFIRYLRRDVCDVGEQFVMSLGG